jgi:hypothetical protein
MSDAEGSALKNIGTNKDLYFPFGKYRSLFMGKIMCMKTSRFFVFILILDKQKNL